MFVCEDCINKFEPVAALATFYKTCEICGERRTCLDLAPNVKRIGLILELIIEHKDGKFINWSMRDPNNPTRKFGEDDVTLIRQVIDGFPEKEEGLLPDPYGDGVGWACKCGHGSHSTEQPPNFCPNCGIRLKGKQKSGFEEPEIHPDILKAARSDGAAHYSTGDGQQYLVTFIGLKETEYEGPDISLEEPQCETGPDNKGNCPYFPSYPTPCQKIRKDHKCPAEDTDPKGWACQACGADQGEFSRNPVTNYPKYPGNCTECGGHVGYARPPKEPEKEGE